MIPTKQIVYLPVNGESEKCVCNDYPDWMDRIEGVVEQEGYFFTPEQLNEYTQGVIKQALETAAEKADAFIDMNEDAYIEGNVWSEVDKQSITNIFEETFKKFEV